MRRLIEFVVRFKNYITLSTLVVMSFALMSVGNLSQLGGFRAVIVGSIGWMQSLFAWIPNPVALKSENVALRELNLQLAVESARSRQSMVENATLRKMLELPQYTDYTLIAADVVGKTTTQLRNYATINKGTEDGVREGMSCITDAGLVGIVIGASQHYAVLQLLINRDTRVSAKDQRTRVDGIIQWEGENRRIVRDIHPTSSSVVLLMLVTSRIHSFAGSLSSRQSTLQLLNSCSLSIHGHHRSAPNSSDAQMNVSGNDQHRKTHGSQLRRTT